VTSGAGVAGIVASQSFLDYTTTVDLAQSTDGPEFSASNTRRFAAGTVLSYIGSVFLAVVGQGVDWDGEFTLTYLGSSA
jgi:hypothetical protein